MPEQTANPKVSVILPTYNRARLLSRALESVLNQTYRDFELILIDDASTDETRQVIDRYHDKRIVYVYLESRRGAACARNTGLKLARGVYIAFQDSDDEWFKEKLALQVPVLDGSPAEVGMVYSDYCRQEDGRTKQVILPKEASAIRNLLFHGNFIPIQCLVKKECFERIGFFDEELGRYQDWDLWLRISSVYQFVGLGQYLFKVYVQNEGISQDNRKRVAALERILEKNITQFTKRPSALAGQYYLLGRIYRREGRPAVAFKKHLKAFLLRPLNLKYCFFLLTCVLGGFLTGKIWRRKKT
ncbi:MAG: glycosyltransferase [Candidatus Omnitrophota bacterium]